MATYRALVVREQEKGHFVQEMQALELDDLPSSEVLVKVHYSSLNYKDALSASGNRGVTRRYPHVPGIDGAGVVVRSPDSRRVPEEKVIVSGFDLGMNHAGGFAEYLSAPADWMTPLPKAMSLEESMVWGTAGFTAAQCVDRLIESGLQPGDGRVVVTGASGGVGSVAVALLAKLGYEVVAVTGKAAETFLKGLGASEVIPRDQFLQTGKKLLLSEKWAGGVDTVGGGYLETMIREARYGAVVTCCGNAASAELNLSVYPFILRGVTLMGIDSARCSPEVRKRLWQKMAGEWKIQQLADLATVITFDSLEEKIRQILAGGVRGRVVVKMV